MLLTSLPFCGKHSHIDFALRLNHCFLETVWRRSDTKHEVLIWVILGHLHVVGLLRAVTLVLNWSQFFFAGWGFKLGRTSIDFFVVLVSWKTSFQEVRLVLALGVPFFDLVGYLGEQLFVVVETAIVKVVVCLTHIRHEIHHLNLGPEIGLCLNVVNLVLESHGNQCFIQTSYPRVTQGLISCVSHLVIELGQSVEQICRQAWQVLRELKSVELQELTLITFSAEVFAREQRMLASRKQHVQDNASCKDIDSRWVELLFNQFWTHEDEGSYFLCVTLLFVLGTQTKIGEFDARKVIWIWNEYVVRLEISVDNFVAV